MEIFVIRFFFGLKICSGWNPSFGLFRNRKPDRRCCSQRQDITAEVPTRASRLFSTRNTSAGAWRGNEATAGWDLKQITEVGEWVRWVNSGWHMTVNLLGVLEKEVDWWKERSHRPPLYLTSIFWRCCQLSVYTQSHFCIQVNIVQLLALKKKGISKQTSQCKKCSNTEAIIPV